MFARLAGPAAALDALAGEILKRWPGVTLTADDAEKFWRDARELRRTLNEISRLSDRELADIGLGHDEIVRLRSSEVFMPRDWQPAKIVRGDLPF